MGGDLGLKPVARGQPPEPGREPPNHDGRGEREDRRGGLQQTLKRAAGHPLSDQRGKMCEAHGENKQGEQGRQRRLAGIGLPALFGDVEQRDGNGQQGQGDDAIGDGMKQREPGGIRF